MAPGLPHYPASELDDRDQLLQALGGFWDTAYAGADLVASTLYSRGRLAVDSRLRFTDLSACMSMAKTPLYRSPVWQVLTLKESALNTAGIDSAEFDGTYAFDSGLHFDQPAADALAVWPIDPTLVNIPVIANRITESSATWVYGVDFIIDRGCLWLRQNPFQSELFSPRELFGGDAVVDREIDLWLYRGQWDEQTLYNQYGYAVGDMPTPSSEAYRNYLLARYAGNTQGPSLRIIEDLFSAVCDVSLTQSDGETVERVSTDTNGLVIVTNQTVYRFVAGSTLLVSVGDVLQAGQPLTDTLRLYEFNRGQTPAALLSLTMTPGFLAAGYFSGLTFANTTTPWVVEPDDPSGYTKLSFAVGGFPGDVDKFWADIHAAGVAANQTLAMLLDQRPPAARDTRPMALALPAEVNPLQFLIENVLRNNAFVVKLRADLFGPNALGMPKLQALRNVMAPHTACLILLEIGLGPDTVSMTGAGDTETPGYTENLNVFLGCAFLDTIDPDSLIIETVNCFTVGGQFI